MIKDLSQNTARGLYKYLHQLIIMLKIIFSLNPFNCMLHPVHTNYSCSSNRYSKVFSARMLVCQRYTNSINIDIHTILLHSPLYIISNTCFVKVVICNKGVTLHDSLSFNLLFYCCYRWSLLQWIAYWRNIKFGEHLGFVRPNFLYCGPILIILVCSSGPHLTTTSIELY